MTKDNSIDNKFKYQKISTLFWRYALPAIIGSTVSTLYNIVNGVFIGHWVGRYALSATGLILPIMNISAAVGMLVGVGSASRISILLGKNNHQQAEKIAGTSFVLTLLLSGLTVSLLLYYVDPVLYFVGSSPENHGYAKQFLLIFLPGSLFLTLTFNFNNMMRACGYPLKAMVTLFISVIANIILAPIFIIHLNMGMKGAAIATTISMMISFVFVMRHFVSPKSIIKLHIKYFTLSLPIVKAIISIGLSPFFLQVASSIVVVFINWQLNHYAPKSGIAGDDAIAAFSNANRLTTLIIMIVIGINQGMQPIVGYNYGAGNYSRVKKTFFYAIKIATVISSLGFILGFFIPHVFVSAFSSQEDMVNLSAITLRYLTLAYIVVGFQMVTTSFFQCIGKAKISIILSLSRHILILIPTLYILPLFFGLDGVWYSAPVGDILSTLMAFIILSIYFYRNRGLYYQSHKTSD